MEDPWVDFTQTSIYRLSSDEIRWCEEVGRKRNSITDPHGVHDRFKDGRLGPERHMEGAKGEYGYFRMLKKDPLIHMISEGKDPGYDDVIEGKRIQVKTTRYHPAHLKLYINDIDRCDFAVAMSVTGDLVRSSGYLPMKRFLKIACYDSDICRFTRDRIVKAQSLAYLFLLPFHCRYGDEWMESWLSKTLHSSEEEMESISVLPITHTGDRDPERIYGR